MLPFYGIKIHEDPNMHDKVPDWSCCRSPSRAKRRHAKGIKTRMFLREVPWTQIYQFKSMGDALVMHPSIARELKRQIGMQHTKVFEERMGDWRRWIGE